MRKHRHAALIGQEQHPRDSGNEQQWVADPRELLSIVYQRLPLGLATMTINADSPNRDLVLVPNLIRGHYSHIQGIHIERIFKV
jgi:hypothetical protein